MQMFHDKRDNHDSCVECGKLVGTNRECENCRRVSERRGTPIGPPAAARGYCGLCDDCPLDPEWLTRHVAVHHVKARTLRAA